MKNSITRTPAAMAGAALAAALLLSGCSNAPAPGPTATGHGLPSGFPTAVPVAQPVESGSHDRGSWRARSVVADSEAQQKALKKLEAAGFVVIGQTGDGDERTYSLADGTYSVRLGFERDGDDYVVTYGVSPRAAH